MFERILLVCTGNLCRSPLAEAMLRLQLAADGHGHHTQVRSAGTKAALGRHVDDTVLFVAQAQPELVAELQRHRSQPVDRSLTWWADLILVMESRQAQAVSKVDPSASHKIRHLGDLIHRPIPDPYLKHESVYREVHGVISSAVVSWRYRISA